MSVRRQPSRRREVVRAGERACDAEGEAAPTGLLATGRGRALALAGVLVLAAAIRIYASPPVYTAEGVHLGPDSDPYYHVLRARELAVRGHVVWRDPGMNYPEGADVLWPPGFDAVLAGVAWATALGSPTDAWVERVAPVVPLALGVLGVALAALLGGEVLGGGLAVGAALLLATTHPHLQYTSLQRPDQHAAELALFALTMLLFARALRPAGRGAALRASVAAGLVVALAFWTWQGSAVLLLVLGGFAGAWHALAPEEHPDRGRPALALGVCGVSAALFLAPSIALLGPPGALEHGALTGISGLAPAVCLGAGVFGLGLAHAARRPRPARRRVVEIAVAAAVPVAAASIVPGTREGILHGLAALAASSPWYARIREYQPLLGSGIDALPTELLALVLKFGLAPVAVVFGVPPLWRVVRRDPARSARAALLLAAGAILLALTLARHRFEMYLALPVALVAAAGIDALARRWFPSRPARAAALLGAATVAPMLVTLPSLRVPLPAREAVIALARQLGEVHVGEPRGVLASWDRGHDIRYHSGLPVLATPFGTDLGPRALDDSSRFWLARTEEEAWEVLRRRRVRWLLLEPPEPEVALGQALLGREGYVVERHSLADGASIDVTPAASALVSIRLYRGDGLARGDAALTRFRLVQEVAGAGQDSIKLFEVVPAAVLRVSNAPPGAPVDAATEVVTPDRRTFVWAASAVADGHGVATLRVPYATGPNGAVGASPYAVTSGGRRGVAAVTEDAVRTGAEVAVPLP